MCKLNASPIALQHILNVLSAKLEKEEVFTAFDVTTATRSMSSENIDHSDVREIVHNEFNTGEFPVNYNQGPIELTVINNPVAIVYYTDGSRPTDHPLARQHTGTNSPSTSPVAALGITAPSSAAPNPKRTKLGGKAKDGDGFICNVTCDGRVNIPKEIYAQVRPDGGVFDVQISGSIRYKKPIGVDDRLVLTKSDLAGGQKFRVDVDVAANTINVEQI